jgi:hypothetical protein
MKILYDADNASDTYGIFKQQLLHLRKNSRLIINRSNRACYTCPISGNAAPLRFGSACQHHDSAYE